MIRVTYIGQVPGPGGAAGEWQPGEVRTVTNAVALRLRLGWPSLFKVERDSAVVGADRLPSYQVR